MIRTCKHCEDEFDCQSAEKQRVGGYINEYLDRDWETMMFII